MIVLDTGAEVRLIDRHDVVLLGLHSWRGLVAWEGWGCAWG